MRKKMLAGILLFSLMISSFSNVGYTSVQAAEYEDNTAIITEDVTDSEGLRNEASTELSDEGTEETSDLETGNGSSLTPEVLSEEDSIGTTVNSGSQSEDENISESLTTTEDTTTTSSIKASGKYDTWSWSLDSDGVLIVSGDIHMDSVEGYYWPWYNEKYSIKKAYVIGSATGTLWRMFLSCSNLTEIDFSDFDTSQVTSMDAMFYGCKSITSLDLKNFDTSNVTDMSAMFCDCYALEILDLRLFDTSNVTNMSNMFSGCKLLFDLRISTFDTSNVTNMSAMFRDCTALTNLDLSNFNTSKVYSMNSMFSTCKNLTQLNVCSFDTRNVKDMRCMYQHCESLKSLDLSSFDLNSIKNDYDSNGNYIDNCYYFIFYCNSLEEIKSPYNISEEISFYKEARWLDEDGRIVNTMHRDLPYSVTYHLPDLNKWYKWSLSNDGVLYVDGDIERQSYDWPWIDSAEKIKKVVVTGNSGINLSYLFAGCTNLTDVDLTGFHTDNAIYMTSMFEGCSSLQNLDLSNFNTENVLVMSGMFKDCKSLNNLDLSSFNTGNVRHMTAMFDNCSGLTNLNLSNFDLSSIVDITDYLLDCNSLTKIKIPYNISHEIALPIRMRWFDENEQEVMNMQQYNTESVTYYGIPRNTYEIRLYGNGGSNSDTPIILPCYADIIHILPTNPCSRNGYLINEWNTEADGSGTAYANGAEVCNLTSEDGGVVTLYAQWKPITYKVAFHANGGTGTMTTITGRTYGIPFNLTKNTFKRAGYTFLAWNTKKDGSGVYIKNKKTVKNLTSVNGKTVTLYAIWKKVTVGQASTPVLSNPSAGKLLVAYKPVTGAQGYMIQLSTNSAMRNSKTVVLTENKKIIPGVIKGKTYYVRVVAFKMDSTGKKVFGKFSPIQKKRIFR
ncbi:MAG: BspA family leucine-rich repeat surface protein [Lachnospiraceae bacterium]